MRKSGTTEKTTPQSKPLVLLAGFSLGLCPVCFPPEVRQEEHQLARELSEKDELSVCGHLLEGSQRKGFLASFCFFFFFFFFFFYQFLG